MIKLNQLFQQTMMMFFFVWLQSTNQPTVVNQLILENVNSKKKNRMKNEQWEMSVSDFRHQMAGQGSGENFF